MTIASLSCVTEGTARGVHAKWSKDFMETGERRLADETTRATDNEEMTELRRELPIRWNLL